MSLYYAGPYNRMMANRRMFHRLMNDAWNEVPARVAFPMDVKDGEDAYELAALLPGVTAEDVNIQIVNDVLTIQGEMKADVDENETYLMRERPAGKFSRGIRLPEAVDSTKVEASLKDGVLTLRIPKAEEAKPKTIKVMAK